MQQQNRDLQWYAKELGLAPRIADGRCTEDSRPPRVESGADAPDPLGRRIREKACRETEGTHQDGRILTDQVSGAAGQKRVA